MFTDPDQEERQQAREALPEAGDPHLLDEADEYDGEPYDGKHDELQGTIEHVAMLTQESPGSVDLSKEELEDPGDPSLEEDEDVNQVIDLAAIDQPLDDPGSPIEDGEWPHSEPLPDDESEDPEDPDEPAPPIPGDLSDPRNLKVDSEEVQQLLAQLRGQTGPLETDPESEKRARLLRLGVLGPYDAIKGAVESGSVAAIENLIPQISEATTDVAVALTELKSLQKELHRAYSGHFYKQHGIRGYFSSLARINSLTK